MCTKNNEGQVSREAGKPAPNRAPSAERGSQLNHTPLASKKYEGIQFVKPIRLQILKIKPVWTILSFTPSRCWLKLSKAYHPFTCKIKHGFLHKQFYFFKSGALMFGLLRSCKLEPGACRCVNYIFQRRVAGKRTICILNRIFTLDKLLPTPRAMFQAKRSCKDPDSRHLSEVAGQKMKWISSNRPQTWQQQKAF